MITLYGWGPQFDCPSPSPYVMKTEIQLQMLGVAFDRAVADLDAVPKHKAPYVMDGDLLVQDSNFIRAHFEKKLGRSLAAGLSDEDSVTSWALERMAEDHLATVMAMERWLKDDNFFKGPAAFFSDVPEPARAGVMKEVREGIAAGQYARGMGRHTEAERMQLAAWDLQAIAIQLAGQRYLFGDEPTVADASVSAVLISCATEFFDTPLTGLVRDHTNLVGYMDRMKAKYFTKNRWPVPEMA
ncbi:glutathione S-transferase family protein [Hyphomonas johnsonii]|uniref:Glutathione S-transferase n=1 Tax=Hyphomonas johnsonii MHS-2 TaxID=1280950 RepID=A0A059FPF7_9PROT|nr:glutathione S-transferase family protein [Hyphomonas johnsonii]KCZ92416.1 glutathione S-transferase [Hyphomonas johnsonii MHS-2]